MVIGPSEILAEGVVPGTEAGERPSTVTLEFDVDGETLHQCPLIRLHRLLFHPQYDELFSVQDKLAAPLSIKSMAVRSLGGDKAQVTLRGEFLPGTSVVLGATQYTETSGLTRLGMEGLSFVAPLADLALGQAAVWDAYGRSVPIISCGPDQMVSGDAASAPGTDQGEKPSANGAITVTLQDTDGSTGSETNSQAANSGQAKAESDSSGDLVYLLTLNKVPRAVGGCPLVAVFGEHIVGPNDIKETSATSACFRVDAATLQDHPVFRLHRLFSRQEDDAIYSAEGLVSSGFAISQVLLTASEGNNRVFAVFGAGFKEKDTHVALGACDLTCGSAPGGSPGTGPGSLVLKAPRFMILTVGADQIAGVDTLIFYNATHLPVKFSLPPKAKDLPKPTIEFNFPGATAVKDGESVWVPFTVKNLNSIDTDHVSFNKTPLKMTPCDPPKKVGDLPCWQIRVSGDDVTKAAGRQTITFGLKDDTSVDVVLVVAPK
jgi:hypothetical protein